MLFLSNWGLISHFQRFALSWGNTACSFPLPFRARHRSAVANRTKYVSEPASLSSRWSRAREPLRAPYNTCMFCTVLYGQVYDMLLFLFFFWHRLFYFFIFIF
ncbi:hypothetical protein BDV10DRAFT_163187, partial [Aspergillus recurvatus]